MSTFVFMKNSTDCDFREVKIRFKNDKFSFHLFFTESTKGHEKLVLASVSHG